ncbi:MAG: colicin V production protein [Desulfuromonas sp.]|nr:MAG: colicin V production protein [Desulfuromonas sp.]
MNGFDIAILVILIGFLIKGLLRGLLKEACSLAGLFLGAFLAFRFHGPLADALLSRADLPVPIALGITFSTLFLTTMILFLALGFLLSKFVKLLFLGCFNRLLGGLFGLIQATLLLAVVMFALSLRPLPWGWDKTLKQSQLAPPFTELGKAAFEGSRQILR